MNELIQYKLPAEILALLMQRGAGIPSLKWHEHPIRLAKSTLDEIDDAKLFHPRQIRDDAGVSALRGLIYLWSGWPDECRSSVEAAPEPERLYLRALCERQAENTAATKELLQQLDGHPIYEPLAEHTLQFASSVKHPLVKRFMGLLDQDKNWEAFLFTDLYNQALAGKLDQPGIDLVRSLIAKEAGLLFQHCYEGIVGGSLTQPSQESRKLDLGKSRKLAQQHRTRSKRHQPPARTVPEKTKTVEIAPPPPAAVIKIMCPKCRKVASLPASCRGKIARCDHCRTPFQVPTSQAAGAGKP